MTEEEEHHDEQKKPLLTLAIELGDKKKQLLNIYIDSKPEQLAYDFCLQNNLDFDSMHNLTEEIKNALSNYKNDPDNQEVKDQNKDRQNQKKEEAREETDERENQEHSQEIEVGEEEIEQHQEQEFEQEMDQEHEEINHEEDNDHEILQNEQNKENESGPKTEEVSEENNGQENHLNFPGAENQENHIMEEHEDEHHDNDGENNANEKNDINKNVKSNENLDKNHENKKDENENEEELAKEEEGDEMMDMNENGEEEDEEEENVVSYLSPTICFQYKQNQIAQPKPKPEFADFDTTFKKKDKVAEFVKELHEEVVTHLDINQKNQKYLPKDYYDNPEGKNFGERLYQRELKLKEEAMEKVRNKVEKENKAKEENLTFVPKINEINVVYLQNRKMNKMQYNDEKKILNYKDYLKAKEDNTKNKFFEEIEKENTFMPRIDKNSEKMAGNRNIEIPRYEQLYKQKLDIKKLEKKIYDDPNMFKPKINKNYKGLKGSKSVKNDKNIPNKKMLEYASLTFEERQKKFQENIQEKKAKLLKEKNTNIDSKTGKKYFKPTINKNKKLEDERKNKPVFNELYSDSEKYKIKKGELEKKVLELEQFNTKFKASVRSEEMYDKQKNIAFEKIFKRLDNDRDGKISKTEIDLTGISKRIIKIISPIIDELKNSNKAMTSEQFIQKCENIYGDLNYADKKELFVYSMGGVIKSVYDTEPYIRKKKVNKKNLGKALK